MNSDLQAVSVVMPVYNGEAFVETAIRSVLEQTHSSVELIAIDDGSTDDSIQVIQAYQDRVKVVRQQNTGVAGARNTGIHNATGEYIAFLDQDDWWRPEKVSRQLEVFQSDSRIGLVHTAVTHIDADSGQEVGPLNPLSRPAEMIGDCSRSLLLGNPIYNSSVMVRRSVLKHVGNCDAEMAGNTVADYDLWLRIAAHYHFGYVDKPLTCYRMHEQQGILDRRAMLTAELRVLLRIQDEKSWQQDAASRARLAGLYDSLAVAWYDDGDLGAARRYFADSLRVAKSKRALKRWVASQLPAFIVERFRN